MKYANLLYLSFLKKIYQKNLALFSASGTFPLPDLSDCLLPGGQCSCMTPQGICTTKDYIVVTAYCNIKRMKQELKNSITKKNSGILPKKRRHTHSDVTNQALYEKIKSEPVHHSCLIVFSKITHKKLAVLELPDHNHVGGITYDGTNLWIAKSTDRCLSVIKEQELQDAVEKAQFVPSSSIAYYQDKAFCEITASFVTYHQNRLWVGYCAPAGKTGLLQSFQILKNPLSSNHPFSLRPCENLSIPAKVNGASFYHNYLFLNLSGGRNKTSKIILYSLATKDNMLRILEQKRHFLLPPLLEESCIDENIFYTLYESSSPAYCNIAGNSCHFPVDSICMTAPEQLIS